MPAHLFLNLKPRTMRSPSCDLQAVEEPCIKTRAEPLRLTCARAMASYILCYDQPGDHRILEQPEKALSHLAAVRCRVRPRTCQGPCPVAKATAPLSLRPLRSCQGHAAKARGCAEVQDVVCRMPS